MKPISVTIEHFRGWRSSGPIPLDAPLTVVVGDNRAGKSSLLLAIEWCLFGRTVESAGTSGIAERKDFDKAISPRDAPPADTVVTLTCTDGDGREVRITRCRVVGGKRVAEELEVVRAGDVARKGAQAEGFVVEHLADYETWRRAHAFHADAARARLFVEADRAGALADLLGLEAGADAREALKAAGAHARLDAARDGLRALERDLLAISERPRRDRDEAERRLAARGIPRAELGAARAARVRGDLVARARTLARRLGFDAALPDPADADAVRRFAEAWAPWARKTSPALEALPAIRKEVADLSTALAAIEPPERAYREAQGEFREAVAAEGDAAARTVALARARTAREAAEEAQKRAGAAVALLSDARRMLTGSQCPVCGAQVEALAGRLDAELHRLRGPDAAGLEKARADAVVAERTAAARVTALEALVAKGQRLRAEWDKAKARLLALVPGAVPDADAVALARTRLEARRTEVEALEGLAAARDEALAAHARDAETLRELEAWTSAEARVDRDVDVAALPSYPAHSAALDAVAGLSADVERLDALVREVQEERSKEREAEVNASLSKYYRLVVGEDPWGLSVAFESKAKVMRSELRDRAGRPLLPVLNQAHLNALSIALLFAQAEARARARGLAFAVLDDPAQHLDEARQQGLVRAIEALLEHAHVVVGTTEGVLAQRLASHVATRKRVLRLEPYDAARGARLLAGGDDA